MPPKQTPTPVANRLTMWVAVGVTMSVIVTLWALLLPRQLAHLAGSAGGPMSRWVVRKQEAQGPTQSFSELLEKQRAELGKMETDMRKEDAATAPADTQPQ